MIARDVQWASVLLAIGAVVGLGAAVSSMLWSGDAGERPLPESAVARVNDTLIARGEFERVLEALQRERREPLGEEVARRLLDRLVEEELLVQYGLEIGLARHDRRVRADIVAAVMQAQVAAVAGEEPSEEELRAFYAENREVFQTRERIRLRHLWIRTDDARPQAAALERAREAARRLQAGEPFERVQAALGDEPVVALPDVPLSPAKLLQYLGPSATQAALALAGGATSEPLVSGEGVSVLQMVGKSGGDERGFEQLRAELASEMRRRAADRALRAKLDELRAAGRVQLAESLP